MDTGILGAMSHADLYRLRQQTQDPELQNLLAGYEHRAFAREATAENPWLAPSLAVATPLYQLYKLLGLGASRSQPSMNQAVQGLTGVGEGLLSQFR